VWQKNMHGKFSLGIVFSLKLPIILKRFFKKHCSLFGTGKVYFSNKYPFKLSRQMQPIVYISLKQHFEVGFTRALY